MAHTQTPYNALAPYLNYVDPSQRPGANNYSVNSGRSSIGWKDRAAPNVATPYAGDATAPVNLSPRVSPGRSAPITPQGAPSPSYSEPGMSGQHTMILGRIKSLLDQASYAEAAPTGPVAHPSGSMTARLAPDQVSNLTTSAPGGAQLRPSGNITGTFSQGDHPGYVIGGKADSSGNRSFNYETGGRTTPAPSPQTIQDRKTYAANLRAQAAELQRQADLHDRAEAAPINRYEAETNAINNPAPAPSVQAAQVRAAATTQSAETRAQATTQIAGIKADGTKAGLDARGQFQKNAQDFSASQQEKRLAQQQAQFEKTYQRLSAKDGVTPMPFNKDLYGQALHDLEGHYMKDGVDTASNPNPDQEHVVYHYRELYKQLTGKGQGTQSGAPVTQPSTSKPTVVRTGTHADGRKVFQMSDGSVIDEQGNPVQ